ncbi:MAG: hypothetical protein AAF938_03985 [Myxococcota bacterium]
MPPPFHYQHGALVRSGLGPSYGATVEQHVSGARMIGVVASDYATSLLDSLTSAFLRDGDQSAERSAELIRAVSPPFASGGALFITEGSNAFVALAGSGRCYLQRNGALESIEPGPRTLLAGDQWLVAIGDAQSRVGARLFTEDAPAKASAEFRNDTLDEALKAVLADCVELQAIAATWSVGA